MTGRPDADELDAVREFWARLVTRQVGGPGKFPDHDELVEDLMRRDKLTPQRVSWLDGPPQALPR